MKELLLPDVNKLEDRLNKIYSIKHTSTNKHDALWKYAVCIDFIEKTNLNSKLKEVQQPLILDVGTADSYMFIYLMTLWNHGHFIGIDTSNEYLQKVDTLMRNNNLLNVKCNYFINDFMKQVTLFGDNTFDFIYDNCSVIHFKTSSELSYNDGLYITGKAVHRILKPNSYFILSCDYNDDNEKGEFIKRTSIIKTLEQAGLTYQEEFSSYVTHENINKTNINMDTITKFGGYENYKHLINNRPHEYGVVFLAFIKK